FLVDFVLAVIVAGSVIHVLMSSADSFAPTPSSALCLPPLPAIEWHVWHFCAVYTAWPFLTWSSCARAIRGAPTTNPTASAVTSRPEILATLFMCASVYAHQ